ncbi:uncharacterized protein LOC108998501 isoform X2 [Juglans regia]|nr:uncharacterized protein LOC108998501 isoform X2 [Juglans regia]
MAASVAIEKTFVSGSEETSISEDSDCIFDMRSHRPWKRSLFDDENFEPTSFPASKKHRMALDDRDEEDPPMDEDYKKFMYTLEKYCKEHFQSLEEEEVGKGEEEDEDIDPQYGMFMENLREDGKSYMLEIYGEDVMPLCIKYEGEEKLSGGSGNKWATPGDKEKSHSATSAGEDIANSATPGEDGSTSTTTGERYSRNATIPREEDEKILATPGKEGRRNSSARREEYRRNLATPRNEDRRDSTTSRVKKHWWNVLRMEGKKSLEVPYNESNIMNEIKMETSYPTNRVSNEADWGSAVNPEIYQLHPNRRQLENIAADILAKCGKRLRYENNDGESFLHARKIVKNSAVKLEDDDEGAIAGKEKLADTKRLPMNLSLSYIGLNVIKMDIHNQWHAKKMTGGARAQFRERLLEILSIPYNQREYKELWHEITDRKPMKRHRDLRGRIIVYDAGPGKSYLDYYSDLAKKINLVRLDHAEVLNLLRGFFYWLMNLSHEGAFRPWLDSSCLEVEQLDAASD